MDSGSTAPRILSTRALVLGAVGYLVAGVSWVFLGHALVHRLPFALRHPAVLVQGILLVCFTLLAFVVALRLGRIRERALEGQLRSVLQGMADPVVVVDRHGRVSRANAAALRLVPRASLLEGPIPPLLEALGAQHADGASALWSGAVLETLLAGGSHPPEELLVRDADGREATLQLTFSPVRPGKDQPPFGMVVVGRDITELKRLERLRDAFLATAAHELKTPAAAMKGYAQLLQRWAPGGHTAREGRAFQVLIRQGERLARVTDELLAVSRLQLGRLDVEPERIRLDQRVGEWVEALQGLSPLHTLRWRPPARPLWARADPGRLEHVVSNLIDNAIKYSPDGGDVEIRLQPHGEDAVMLQVRDWGMGMPADRQAGVFELYHRVHAGRDEDRGGLGVGLYVSRALIEKMEGTIGFESEEGEGSTFWLTLPRVFGPAAEEVEVDATIGAPG